MSPDTTGQTIFISEDRDFKLLRTSRLVVTKGDDPGRELNIQRERVTIGRSSSCDLVLRDRSVSALHAEVVTTPEGYLLRDLNSTNGVYLRGHRVREIYLIPDTQFQIGNNLLRFEPLEAMVRIPLSTRDHFGRVLGNSIKMRQVFAVLEKVAPSDLPVLLRGDTGTGKELLAAAIHTYSLRKNHAFVVLDCGAVPASLIESTLFGHEKGAFTGADQTHRGLFEEADGGTVFIDEVGELELQLQPKLLRVLEQHEVQRVGGLKRLPVSVRIVAATHRNLREMVEAGTFREDLLYRLSVVEVEIPPLRERPEDIPVLVGRFLGEGNEQRKIAGLAPVTIEPEAMALLQAHPWPGNVRELRNAIERSVHLATGKVVGRKDLMLDLFGSSHHPALTVNCQLPYKEAKARLLEHFERHYLSSLMAEELGNLSRASRRAGLARQHLRHLCRRYAIPVGADARPEGDSSPDLEDDSPMDPGDAPGV